MSSYTRYTVVLYWSNQLLFMLHTSRVPFVVLPIRVHRKNPDRNRSDRQFQSDQVDICPLSLICKRALCTMVHI
jgi:hypothetical protein